MSLRLIPRALAAVTPSTVISRPMLVQLHQEHLRVADSFASYNFREYFVRRTERHFRPVLDHGLPAPSQSEQVTLDAPDSIYAPTSTPSATAVSTTVAATPEQRLNKWYLNSLHDLEILTRSAMINQLYEGQKLVVEGRIVPADVEELDVGGGGGGAGAEAGYDITLDITSAADGDAQVRRRRTASRRHGRGRDAQGIAPNRTSVVGQSVL